MRCREVSLKRVSLIAGVRHPHPLPHTSRNSLTRHDVKNERSVAAGAREGEHDVDVLDRQQILGLTVEPRGSRGGLALGAAPVAA
jgi:hypothetical protein